jgi:cell division protein YceG involved in septum cleavage
VVERRPGVMPPKPGPPPRQVSRRRIRARRFGVLGALVAVAFIALGIVKLVGHHSTTAPPTTTAVLPPPKPFRIVFPEGFTRTDMSHRVTDVAKIAENKSHKHVQLSARGYLHWSQPQAVTGFGAKRRSLEGFLFPATYDFLRNTASKQLVKDQLDAFHANWDKVDLAYARKKNLTPYDVLIIASLVEKEALAPDERPKIARVIYNRLKAHMNLGIDATTRYGLHVPGTQSLTESELASTNPYNTRNPNIIDAGCRSPCAR